MTETPKCPYCGAEMKVDAVRLTQHNWVGWSHCENCRSVGPSKSKCYTEKEAEEAAISAALHRAEPEMKPLTLEEVNANCVENSNSVLLYVEFWQVPTASRWIMIHEKDVTRNRNSVAIENYLKSKGQKYNILWRCWPRKPTPEQMTAAKWED